LGGIHQRHYFALFVIAQSHTGNKREGLIAIKRAKKMIIETGELFWHSDVLRIEGELAFESGSSAQESERCFVQALKISRPQLAKSFELRAATSLARLWRDQGKRTEAQDLLAPVYGWFTEGFDTLDLKEAKTLLNELAR
jgi:predicted ATPase